MADQDRERPTALPPATNGNCAGVDDAEPAGDAFVDPSEINPRRRIVRAHRPPQSIMTPAVDADAAGGAASDVGDGNSAPDADATDSGGDDEQAGNNAINRDSNAGSDLSSAIGFLQQLNHDQIPSVSDANAVGDNDDGDSTNATPTESETGRILRGMQYRYGEEQDEEEAEAASDDDDASFGPHSHFMGGFFNTMSEMARRNSRRPREKLCEKIRPDDDDDEESDDGEEDGEVCAACFRSGNQNHKWRRLVTLPCCGTNGRETNSSTRFCAACILKLAVTRQHSSNSSEYRLLDDEPDEYPVRKFYQKNLQTDNRRFCECPRCRDILLIKIKGVKTVIEDGDDDSSECDCDCSDCETERRERRSERNESKTAKSISLHVPSFKAKCWYIGRKRGVAKLLWKVSSLHHNFIPYEALGGDDENANILKLASWGIIKKRDKYVYQMDRDNQTKLIKFFRLGKNPSEKDEKCECRMMSEFGPCMCYAAWCHLRDEFRIDRSLRILNRLFALLLHFFGYLPPLPLSWWQELTVTALNAFSVAMIGQFLCVFIVYTSTFFGVGLSTCYVLKRSNNLRSFWWKAIIVSYFAYRLNKLFYHSPYLSWNTLVSPKAMVPVKAFFWG